MWHTGYHIKIELTHADLGHPDRPGLLDEITRPIEQRDRELLQCLQHHAPASAGPKRRTALRG